jgi:ABC-type phosphate transport system ATPase subunit
MVGTMTPEQVEAILTSNAKAIASNSNAIAESRREINSLYQIGADLARDRAVMYEILRGLNEDRVRTAENISILAEQSSRQNQLLERIADALENQDR